MHDNTRQRVLVVLFGILKRLSFDLLNELLHLIVIASLLLEFLYPLTLGKTLLSVRLHVEIDRELAVVIDLDSDHAIIIEFEAL